MCLNLLKKIMLQRVITVFLLVLTVGCSPSKPTNVKEDTTQEKQAAALLKYAERTCLSDTSLSGKGKAGVSGAIEDKSIVIGAEVNQDESKAFFKYLESDAANLKERDSIRECMAPFQKKIIEIFSGSLNPEALSNDINEFNIRVADARAYQNTIYFTVLFDNEKSTKSLNISKFYILTGSKVGSLNFGHSMYEVGSNSSEFEPITVRPGESIVKKYKVDYKNYFEEPYAQFTYFTFDIYNAEPLRLDYADVDFTRKGIKIVSVENDVAYGVLAK